jgi:hypothetical protein
MNELAQTNDVEVPMAIGLNGRGPVFVVGPARVEPEQCDHAGYGWSQAFLLRCGRCGVRMALPSRMIAFRSEDEIDEMERAWLEAGAPEFRHVPVETDAGVVIMLVWDLDEGWVLTEHPLFEHLGGLPMPVRPSTTAAAAASAQDAPGQDAPSQD